MTYVPVIEDSELDDGWWYWFLYRPTVQGFAELACGRAESEDLAEQAANSVRRLLEGTCKNSL